jgi:hypothetical protein
VPEFFVEEGRGRRGGDGGAQAAQRQHRQRRAGRVAQLSLDARARPSHIARRPHLLDDGLQAVLELSAVLCARDERPHVERHEDAALQRGGHVAGDDALREALGDGGLADAGLRWGGGLRGVRGGGG